MVRQAGGLDKGRLQRQLSEVPKNDYKITAIVPVKPVVKPLARELNDALKPVTKATPEPGSY